jgi:hypothetical protein
MQTNIRKKFLQIFVATQDKHIEFKEAVLQEGHLPAGHLEGPHVFRTGL